MKVEGKYISIDLVRICYYLIVLQACLQSCGLRCRGDEENMHTFILFFFCNWVSSCNSMLRIIKAWLLFTWDS